MLCGADKVALLRQEYLEFAGGDAKTARANGMSKETFDAIQEWLEKNK